ncbi:lipase [Lysinibacillus contaminans]|uniref:Lipase n=1 Tax=Lysinibacillus contaminans TaxID=1293441 RepID=A0ABR5K531_9BACI|nr:SGNH/GDSL hydrolase family protein [Lysinibacillus contaminans]KOS71503.1 lipase [Lysinibacillus contaminans]
MGNQFVAIGDSFTVGIGDEVEGKALKSWVDHFAQLHTPVLAYTNLAKRGLITKEIREQQLNEAVDMKPTLVSIIAGANDILKGRWNREVFEDEMKLMVETLSKSGAFIIIGNLPDFTVRIPMPPEQKQLIKGQLIEANDIIQTLSNEYNLFHINLWSHSIAEDNTFWSEDLVHPNSLGYQQIGELFFELYSNRKTNG